MTIDLALWYSRCRETSFARANRLADEAKARQQATCDAWWMDAQLWQEPGLHHSATEQLCMESLLAQCPNRSRKAERLANVASIVGEVVKEMKAARANRIVRLEIIPLREFMAARGETVVTLEFGRGESMRQTVPLRTKRTA